MMKTKPIIITPGEPAGVGPDLVVRLAQLSLPIPIVVCADPNLLYTRAKALNLSIKLKIYTTDTFYINQNSKTLFVMPVNLNSRVNPGVLNIKNSSYVIETLKKSYDCCLNGEFSAIVTGPVHKGIINDAGIPFSGHTEFFAFRSCCRAVMMFVSGKMRVALVTTHLRLKDVPCAITKNILNEVIIILYNDLKSKFGIKSPKIYVCGLNPHAGEDGYLGKEEIDIIKPVLDKLKIDGINLIGPLSADTLFLDKYLNDADVVLAMYHDQCLPVLKRDGFGELVNITLGLPVIRTSVDHGVALDLAGTRKANLGSFFSALKIAVKIIDKIYV
ncbi:4-hydroxythreonine-4-phosphate dehydrogenase [Candidatus Providencia siddallii]|uniref:4-hydroxythreonine-4-phosphate dehydrogenase n=1 Tax=Candidatus Providencia siddallii TaxID=1715285 RepID=A0A0M6W6P3_9GAMM|nr:4-hydroxythreonine-4-phosphate dehydrogenase [Candidatus Providencia siddallii]